MKGIKRYLRKPNSDAEKLRELVETGLRVNLGFSSPFVNESSLQLKPSKSL